jgi:hypothetical protein
MSEAPTNIARKRNLQIELSQLIYEELTKRSIFPLGKLSTPKLVASVFPTSRALSVSDRLPEDFNRINIQYWSRIQRGERVLRDAGLITRIGEQFSEMKELLECLLYETLSKPLSTSQKLHSQIQKLSPMFENLLFVSDEKGLVQKKCYWSYTSFNLMANGNFLAYQLTLMRMTALKKSRRHPYLSPKQTTLLLLRILMTTPLENIAETILKAYYYFYAANASALGIETPSVSAQLVDNNPLFYVIEMCLPEAKKLTYMQNFSAYRTYHYDLLETARKALFGDWHSSMLASDLAEDILYWADQYCELWLSNTTEKVALFDKENPIFKNIYNAIHYSQGRHRIW